jgi:hypothetical protein
MNQDGISSIYRREQGWQLVELKISHPAQLFNSLDPSPFRERDLDPDCEEFIVSWARELPPDRPLRIAIHVDRERPAPDLLAAVAPAVQNHFSREASLQDLRRRRLIREGRLSLAIGLAMLVTCIGGATFVPVATLGTPGDILRESLIIAGWVVMWHPLEVLLYGIWPVIRERRLLERLATAQVDLTMPTASAPTE